jgi:hypothetical protein
LGDHIEDTGIHDKLYDIPVSLREGFYCGLEISLLSCTSIPHNHYVSQEDKDFVIGKYAEEIDLGRLSHSYKSDTLFPSSDIFKLHPLQLLIKVATNTM